ncbi:hypothetical protein [Mycobacterium avium]|uniref:Uncharacterized protein n=1 Tax=Mycobacterium avium subsp. hominissuis TaxID=439334 RepID=A0AAI8X2R1_MYCAV|nr:hypothetical protein [Mycobacterium avium]PBA08506.1 hypothetical protein CKJ70_26015 [Mycobacterium avium]BBN50789.1 hypothetical protein JPH1_52640 [Mycobacterium avium subsp. hominissuis]
MTFFDTACLITGVNLRGIDATAVLLHRTAAGQYHPISLGIPGTYDGFGCIDEVPADRNTAALTAFFTRAHRHGRFLAHDHTHAGDPNWFDPEIAIESLLYLVERTTTVADLYGGAYPPCTLLDGHPVVLTLIARPVWDALGEHHFRGPRSEVAATAFGAGAETAAAIYGRDFDHLVQPLQQLAAVSHFIATQPRLRWAPPGESAQRYHRGVGGQFSAEQSRHFVDVARRDYRHDARLQSALDDYVKRVD